MSSADCGVGLTQTLRDKIVGGRSAEDGEFPWQVSLHLIQYILGFRDPKPYVIGYLNLIHFKWYLRSRQKQFHRIGTKHLSKLRKNAHFRL